MACCFSFTPRFILITMADLGWSWKRVFTAMLLGSLPFGGFYVERNWLRQAANVSQGKS
ncbi:MAG: hypothetical protein R2706_10015 [Acidimicrobiales bacterium]